MSLFDISSGVFAALVITGIALHLVRQRRKNEKPKAFTIVMILAVGVCYRGLLFLREFSDSGWVTLAILLALAMPILILAAKHLGNAWCHTKN